MHSEPDTLTIVVVLISAHCFSHRLTFGNTPPQMWVFGYRLAMSKLNDLPRLSEPQLEIMNIIWDKHEATINDVCATLNERRPVARNTVLTVMTRLDEKGWLQHEEHGRVFVYSATVPRQQAQKKLASRLVDSAFGGAVEGLMMALFDGRRISSDEAERIRDIIDAAEDEEQE